MEDIDMITNGENNQLVADPVPFARSYQLEALEIALKQNTIVFFETGLGKTLIAIMLLRSYGHLLRKPSANIAVFLVPKVVLVHQQSEAVMTNTDLKVGKYYGEMGVDYWDAATWAQEKDKHEVLVMTPQILLDALRHQFLRLDHIKVLIFDECHNAKGKDAYVCIMKEFYHPELESNALHLPRIFGMTASPIKGKAASSREAYWKQISKLENLMNSKVFTCDSDSLNQYIPTSTPYICMYNHMDIPHETFKRLELDLINLTRKHELSLSRPTVPESVATSAKKHLKKLFSTFLFCVTELGVWLAMKAAEVYSCEEENIFIWGQMDVSSKRIVRAFSLDAAKVFSASMLSGPKRSIDDLMANVRDGYLTSKVMRLLDILLRYRENKDLRCIVFVERIVTAIVICNLLNELLPEVTGWRTEYAAGSNSILQPQSRKEQNAIVEKFRKGAVNIIIATSMLEEGLDVQSCKLVIRFDPSATICSFIQSRGRARMQNSEFIIMVNSKDSSAISRVKNYLAGGDMMRRECMSHADLPCEPLEKDLYDELLYKVTSTGAIVTLSSSVQLLYVYCSRLPSDGYFKPYPRFTINKERQTCEIHLPNSCPIRPITVQGNKKILKQLACLEACKQLHQHGSLSDNLVPDIVEEEAEAQDSGNEPYLDEHAKYFPQELVGLCINGSNMLYHCYKLELQPDFQYDVKFQDIVLAVQTKLDDDLENLDLDLDADRGKLIVQIKHIGYFELNSEQVALCQRFQNTVFRVLLDHNLDKVQESLNQYSQGNGSYVFNYLFLPALCSHESVKVDWNCIIGVCYPKNVSFGENSCRFSTRGHGHYMHTENGLVCLCMLENSLVCTPHNGMLYCIDGTLQGFDGNTFLELREGEKVTYKQYYQQRHGIKLKFERQTLLKAKRIFTVHNYLDRSRIPSSKESRNRTCELPPELCSIIMSPISVSTFYSFSFLPSVMHRIESLLIAANLKSMHADHCTQNVVIPTILVLEAITTKHCQENIHLESLETLGDSFLKYAASQQLFKTYQNRHEGLLSLKRKKIISNPALAKLGCDRNITGFIRNEQFDPKTWIIPGTNCADRILKEKMLSSSKKVYVGEIRKIKQKTIADVVEALIGAYLSVGGDIAALSFMVWLGIRVDLEHVPYTRNFAVKPEMCVNVRKLESLLNYSFRDATLLVEALTHGSYMLPEIPGCYQRLEFLGDAVLDYLITLDLYDKYPRLSPGLLTDLRSMSVNNDCYGQSAIKWELHKHILYSSTALLQQIRQAVHSFEESPSTFAWESETYFPKVLGDVIESLAGAIFVDSGYNKDIVFKSMKRLLEPLVTLETLKLHPVRELTELCQREQYSLKKTVFSSQNGVVYYKVEVEACGVVHEETQFVTGKNKKTAERLTCKAVLKRLKESMFVKPDGSLA